MENGTLAALLLHIMKTRARRGSRNRFENKFDSSFAEIIRLGERIFQLPGLVATAEKNKEEDGARLARFVVGSRR